MRAGNKKDADDGRGRGQEAPGPMKKKLPTLGPSKNPHGLIQNIYKTIYRELLKDMMFFPHERFGNFLKSAFRELFF
jgi:hypothetical protein